jgi:hypothetical protein
MKYVFIIFGACSIAWGIVPLIVLPDLPSADKFLNERERSVAIDRVAGNRQGVKKPPLQEIPGMADGARSKNPDLVHYGSGRSNPKLRSDKRK